jgi:hypothetical protein
VIYLNDGEIAVLSRDGFGCTKLDGTEVKPDIQAGHPAGGSGGEGRL